MKYLKLLELAKPYLCNNDMGVAHTIRVLEIAKANYLNYGLEDTWKDIVFSLIVLHDIGGSEIKEQYEKGPIIAKELLNKLEFNPFDIKLICSFISRHHERLNNPHDMFRILFDSDQMVKFSKEEFSHYNSKSNFDWQAVIESFYNPDLKNQAISLLKERMN